MKLYYANQFLRSFKKLPAEIQLRVRKAIDIFRNDPFNAQLQNHKLKGRHKKLRAFSAAHDLRIIYKEEENHAVVLIIRVGTHDQVYK